MAIHKVKVVGTCEVNDTASGGVTELDDAVINVLALVDGGFVELLPEPESKKKASKKGDA